MKKELDVVVSYNPETEQISVAFDENTLGPLDFTLSENNKTLTIGAENIFYGNTYVSTSLCQTENSTKGKVNYQKPDSSSIVLEFQDESNVLNLDVLKTSKLFLRITHYEDLS